MIYKVDAGYFYGMVLGTRPMSLETLRIIEQNIHRRHSKVHLLFERRISSINTFGFSRELDVIKSDLQEVEL